MSATLSRITPKPRTRTFIVGSTGSGKSTLSAAIIQHYAKEHPRHSIYVIDPKGRFHCVEPEDGDSIGLLFPAGFRETRHGRRDAVDIIAEPMQRPRAGDDEERAFVVQGEDAPFALFDWLYDHATVTRPSLIYADESFDFQKGVRAHPSLRKLFQQGREIGVGIIIINQRPSWIDRTYLTEAQQIIMGPLSWEEDRKHIYQNTPAQHMKERIMTPLEPLHWLWLDQVKPRLSFPFHYHIPKVG